MSIISEALRRAHFEAVRQDRVQARLYRPPGVADYPLRASRRRMMLVLVATNAALVAAVGFMLWARRAPANPVPEKMRATAPPSVAPAPKPAEAPAPVVATPPPVVEARPREVARKPSPPAVVREVDGLIDGRTYIARLASDSGEEIALSGLTVVGDRGAALMNGKVVWEGDRLGSFLVKRVTRDRVELRYRQVTVFLRLP